MLGDVPVALVCLSFLFKSDFGAQALYLFFFFNTVSFFYLFFTVGSSLLVKPSVGGSVDGSLVALTLLFRLFSSLSTGSRRTDSAVVARGFSCSVLRGLFPKPGAELVSGLFGLAEIGR